MHLPAADFSYNNQQGQASVFVLVLLGVVLLCSIFLYQSGRITTEKMQLQNAADAAAYNASTLEARSLNFSAYTNRAMVANEVAVGQLIGLLSWVDELTQSEEYSDVYTAAIEAAGALLAALLVETAGVGSGIVEAITQIIVDSLDTIAGALTALGEAIEVILDVIVSPTVAGLSIINEAYSISQRIYHGATYATVVKSVYQSLEDNVPGTEFNREDLFKKDLHGAQLSDLGVIALAGHIPSFWSGYTKVYTSSTSAKKKRKKDDKKKKKDDKKKDDKKKDDKKKEDDKKKDDKKKDDKKKDDKKKKKKKKKNSKKDKDNSSGMGRLAATIREARDPFSSGGSPESRNRDWNLEFELKGKFSLKDFFGDTIASIKFDYLLGGESLGASELRNKNDTFIWSAADSSVLGSKLKVAVKLPIIGTIKTPFIPFPAEFPFNAGGYQAPEEMKDLLLPTDILPSDPAKLTYGKRKVEAYGGAVGAAHALAFPGVEKEMAENSIDSYKGLQPYRDMKNMKEKKPGKFSMPFKAPFFLVGVTKALKDITERGPQFDGKFELTKYDSKTNVDRLGAIAKSELYFARPTNLKYFLRDDKKKEKPNVFSPFWQARLVDTSNSDRFLALAMQQDVIWLTEKEKRLVGGSVLDDVLNAIDEILNIVSGVVDRILRLFL